jgi:Periplasmic glucans biosynthesis protein
MIRRDVLKAIAALAALPATAWAEDNRLALKETAAPFGPDTVTNRARILASKPYAPRPMIPEAWRKLTYDQYRQIWFDGRNALWEAPTCHSGSMCSRPVSISRRPWRCMSWQRERTRPIAFDMGVFDTTDQFPDLPVDDTLGYSGLRLRAELEKQGIFQEYAVFQGGQLFPGHRNGRNLWPLGTGALR